MIKTLIVNENRTIDIESEDSSYQDYFGIENEKNAEILKFIFPESINGLPISDFEVRPVFISQTGHISYKTLSSDGTLRLDEQLTGNSVLTMVVQLLKNGDIKWASYPFRLSFMDDISASIVPTSPGEEGDSVGIKSIETNESIEDGGENTVTITRSNGLTNTFVVRNGRKGSDGIPGKDGADGKNGIDGVGISDVSVSSNQELIVTLSDDTEINLGRIVGADGASGKSAYDLAVENGYMGTPVEWLQSLHGQDGYTPEVTVSYYVGEWKVDDNDQRYFDADQTGWSVVFRDKNGKSLLSFRIRNGKDGNDGTDGVDGKSAFDIAVDNGFIGTQQQWLATLKGKDGENGSAGEPGVKGDTGKSAFDIAVEDGFIGSEIQWLNSLAGAPGTNGIDGKSAFEIAVDNGFNGTERQWLDSLKSADIVPDYVKNAADSVAEKVLSVSGESLNNDSPVAAFENKSDKGINTTGEVLNGCGYESGIISSSDGTDAASGSYCRSGYIACRPSSIIRFQNFNWSEDSVDGYHRIACYNSDFEFIANTNGQQNNNYLISKFYPIYSDGYLSQLTIPNVPGIAYFRITSKGKTDTAVFPTAIITVDEEISYSQPETMPDTVPFNFAFLSDIHILHDYNGSNTDTIAKTKQSENSSLHASQALDIISRKVSLDSIVFGGDYVSNWLTCPVNTLRQQIRKTKNYFANIGGNVPQIWCKGNHDGNPFPGLRISKAEVYNRIAKTSRSSSVTNSSDPFGAYGYIDFDYAKIRMIYVNTSDNDDFGNPVVSASDSSYSTMLDANNISATQLRWIGEHGLNLSGKTNPDEWGIIIVSHTELTYDSTVTNAENETYSCNTVNLANMIKAYRTGTSFSTTHNDESVSIDFSGTVKGEIICHIHGHEHSFRESSVEGIKSIGCPNVCFDRTKISSNGIYYNKTADTANDTAFTVFTVDRANRKIHAVCYGAGIDREINY